MIGQEPQHRTTLQEENVNNAGQDMISVMETTNCSTVRRIMMRRNDVQNQEPVGYPSQQAAGQSRLSQVSL